MLVRFFLLLKSAGVPVSITMGSAPVITAELRKKHPTGGASSSWGITQVLRQIRNGSQVPMGSSIEPAEPLGIGEPTYPRYVSSSWRSA